MCCYAICQKARQSDISKSPDNNANNSSLSSDPNATKMLTCSFVETANNRPQHNQVHLQWRRFSIMALRKKSFTIETKGVEKRNERVKERDASPCVWLQRKKKCRVRDTRTKQGGCVSGPETAKALCGPTHVANDAAHANLPCSHPPRTASVRGRHITQFCRLLVILTDRKSVVMAQSRATRSC